MTANLMDAQSRFKQPTDFAPIIVSKLQTLAQEMETVQKKDMKAPPNHIKTVLDGLTLFYWPLFVGDQKAFVDNL